MTPAVSVLLATRDGARHLDAALASLAAQTLSPLEFVLVDDGSRDDSGERLRAFAARQPCARVVRTNGLGLAGALATAAALAHGALLARHDDDDLSHPERLDRQAAHLAAHPEIGVLGTAARIIDDAGRELGAYPVPRGEAAIRRALRRAPPFVHGSVMMTRAAYQAAGGYRAAFRAAQDYDLWLRMPATVGLANLEQPLYAWRHHPGGVFARARATQLVYAALARAFAEERRATGADSLAALAAAPDAEAFVSGSPRRARIATLIGEAHVRDGRVAEGRRWLARAIGWGADPRALAWWAASFPVALTPRAARARGRERMRTQQGGGAA